MATRSPRKPAVRAKSAVKKTAAKRARREPALEVERDFEVERLEAEVATPRVLNDDERDRRFNLLLQSACLKAGTAAAISTITSKVPFLGRLTPVILGSVGEQLVLAKIQQQLVKDIIALYQLELTDIEERGVILLATAANIGATQLSKRTVEQLVKQLGGRLYRPVLSRVLPIASVTTEIAAAIASTYAIGKRAQALCRLPGTGMRDLGQLLRSLTGIEQSRLFKWSGEALSLALKPFRGVLSAVIPGFG